MNKKERMLFFELCKFKDKNQKKLGKLLDEGAMTPHVLGQLFSNRMAGAAYGELGRARLLDRLNREIRNPLKNGHIQNIVRNRSYYNCLSELNKILRPADGKYTFLKGAYLCSWYPPGYRTSNDIDILTEPKNVTSISNLLYEAGFRQGHLRKNRFVPATRREIISSKMMRGETVPFIKEVSKPFMKYLEVDINYSLSYKNEQNDLIYELVSGSKKVMVGDMKITTLSKYDFMIYLCEHLYKEATTYPWVRMMRDMTIYKFCDIYALLCDYSKKDFTDLRRRINKLGLNKACYYAIYITKELFSMNRMHLNNFLAEIQPDEEDILNIVIDPPNSKTYRYMDEDMEKRFFKEDRAKLLEEVT